MNRVAGAWLALLFACCADAQSLVTNGDFDAALDGWTVTGDGEAAADASDIDTDPASGSLLLANEHADAGVRVSPLQQCIAVAESGEFVVGAGARVATGQGSGRLLLSVVYFRGAGCDGDIVGAGGRTLPAGEAWMSLAFVLSPPTDTRSLLLVLAVDKTAAGGRYAGHVDAVMLERSPRIFDDGFE